MAETESTTYHFSVRDSVIGAQMLFVAFGALVLVPLITGLDPNVALFTAGAGTLLFQLITKGKVPIFLASSFAFIAPISVGVGKWGIPGTMCGLAAAGVVYIILSQLVRWQGTQILHKVLPPIVTGPVIMVIGLLLAPVAVNMAQGKSGDGALVLVPYNQAVIVAFVSLLTTIVITLLARGMLRLIPILCGVGTGYITAFFLGLVKFDAVRDAAFISWPNFTLPVWNWEAVIFIVPVAIAPAIEHFGDILAIGSITGRDYLEDPGIHRTLLGDGLATSLASMLGGPPNTTYSEVSGAVAITRVFNPAVMTWASIVAIALAFIGKFGALLSTIPVPVMGGIMILLFGAITVIGLNTLVRAGQDLSVPRNLIVVSLILVSGLGGMKILGLGGIGLAGIMGVVLNMAIPEGKG
ncbi:MAG: uracil-xanthine permease family protein [Pseudomonadota bacterium]